jgi:hypothetical protein
MIDLLCVWLLSPVTFQMKVTGQYSDFSFASQGGTMGEHDLMVVQERKDRA